MSKTAETARVTVTSWATAQFWVEYSIQVGESTFEVSVEFDDRDGFQMSVKETGSDEAFGGDEFATMLGYEHEMDLCDDLTQGMFVVPEQQFALTVSIDTEELSQ